MYQITWGAITLEAQRLLNATLVGGGTAVLTSELEVSFLASGMSTDRTMWNFGFPRALI